MSPLARSAAAERDRPEPCEHCLSAPAQRFLEWKNNDATYVLEAFLCQDCAVTVRLREMDGDVVVYEDANAFG
jgi:hypothetical protein